ncbi:MAG TPA: prepilin-type N-terminal cleavage/methylation domain-containing protein [Lachnospiraceae bacterium]|nr:prepilin-type N-terminal cleavage/methylation domain-containing protein [Lachnospiraceae bacterium]
MKKMGNKGFSLVELIIVIAIIMIVAGIMIPQLVRYLEKSKVAADQETLEAIYKAVVYSMADTEVQNDPVSKAMINNLNTPVTLESLMTPANNKFANEIINTLGWSSLSQATYEELLESAHAPNCEIYLVYKGGVHNPIAMWITTTDSRGKRDTSQNPTTQSAIGICINIQ